MDPTLAVQAVIAGAFVIAVAPGLSGPRTGLACALLLAILIAGQLGQRRIEEEVVAEVAVRAIQKIVQAHPPPVREPARARAPVPF